MIKLSGIKKLFIRGSSLDVEISNRQTGKTDRAVRWIEQGRVYDKKRMIIVFNDIEANRLIRTYGLAECEVMSFRKFLTTPTEHKTELFIDNADYILQHLFKWQVRKININKNA